MGQTKGNGFSYPFRIEEKSRKQRDEIDGFLNTTGNILGTYIHGLLHNEGLRRSILMRLAEKKGVSLDFKSVVCSKEEEYDKLTDIIRNAINMDLVYRTIG